MRFMDSLTVRVFALSFMRFAPWETCSHLASQMRPSIKRVPKNGTEEEAEIPRPRSSFLGAFSRSGAEKQIVPSFKDGPVETVVPLSKWHDKN